MKIFKHIEDVAVHPTFVWVCFAIAIIYGLL